MPGAKATANPPTRPLTAKTTQLQQLIQQRILLLDGAYGTAFQGYKLEESAYRGQRFADHHLPLQGNHDILCLTCPDTVSYTHLTLPTKA